MIMLVDFMDLMDFRRTLLNLYGRIMMWMWFYINLIAFPNKTLTIRVLKDKEITGIRQLYFQIIYIIKTLLTVQVSIITEKEKFSKVNLYSLPHQLRVAFCWELEMAGSLLTTIIMKKLNLKDQKMLVEFMELMVS